MALIVQKFGGMSLETTAKISSIASRIAAQARQGDQLVIVVSAMGTATDQLLELAHQVAPDPSLQAMDVLLNTGEMISMALNAQGCPATGLCGHQAGIQTDDHYSNAAISKINPALVTRSLKLNRVVVVAGFQGENMEGELTTLGRGGSDTTALALAASLGADRCEILKEVPAIFSADPRIIPHAHPLSTLSYEELLDMTFWGAKVLQYRSVEIAKRFAIQLYVGPAHSSGLGTSISEHPMIEDREVLALNSHETVLQIIAPAATLGAAMAWLKNETSARKLAFPQVLHSEFNNGLIALFVTAPREAMDGLLLIPSGGSAAPKVRQFSSVTATCRGATRPETLDKLIGALESNGIKIANLLVSAMSLTMFVEKSMRVSAIELLHALIPIPHPKPQLVGTLSSSSLG